MTDYIPPFDPKFLSSMTVIEFNALAEEAGTHDLRELERLLGDKFRDQILCLPFGDERIYMNPENGENHNFGYHLGADYFLPVGTPVLAVADCKVRSQQNTISPGDILPCWGNLVVTETTDGIYAVYAHIDFGIKIDEDFSFDSLDLKQGDLIGHVAEGWTRENGFWPAHLHFQLQKKYMDFTPGYVDSKEALVDYIDPFELFPVG